MIVGLFMWIRDVWNRVTGYIKRDVEMHISALAGIGRLLQKDDRNNDYLLPKLVVPKEIRHRFWSGGTVLDQKDTPQCVGYAGWGWLAGGPVINHPPFTPTELYHWAQDNDEWPGTNYDGSSTLGLMKALKSKGYINEYRWAKDVEVLIAWILMKGPVLVGTNWYMDFFTPTAPGGFLFPNHSEVVGGHEWRIVGADLDKVCPDGTRGALRMINSWGPAWGDHGRAWITFPVMQRLLNEDGEAVTCEEIKLK